MATVNEALYLDSDMLRAESRRHLRLYLPYPEAEPLQQGLVDGWLEALAEHLSY